MYEQAFSPDKENDERSFDEICDEALKLFKSQCDNIHFKAIDDRDVELISDDNGHNRLKCLSLFDNHHKIRLYRCYVYNKFIFY